MQVKQRKGLQGGYLETLISISSPEDVSNLYQFAKKSKPPMKQSFTNWMVEPIPARIAHPLLLLFFGLCCWAWSLQQAIELMPDLILLDVRIPGEDPRETMRSLAREGWAATTPVVALSPREEDDAALGDGYAGVVRKPVALPALVSTLRSCFEHGPDGGAAAANGKAMGAMVAEPPLA